MTTANGTFQIESWDEKPYEEFEGGRKLTRAAVVQAFHGGIEGKGTTEYLMVYGPDGTAQYLGYTHVVGSVGGRSGSFVMRNDGTFDGSGAHTALSVVRGSGTGDLSSLRGEATARAPLEGTPSFTLEYDMS